MDQRLFKAAQTGDVDFLLNLIKNEPLILRAVALTGGDSPLHVACLAGHLNFVKEILKSGREFSAEINEDGFSPLHIASATGDIEIVRELLKVDYNLCLIKGKDRRIPLHYAAINGKVNVIKELLSASVNSVEDYTARGETALHLAVKNHQFEAFEALLDHVKKFKKEDVLNGRDGQGNTILHLAVLRKQYEVVDLVLKGNDPTNESLEVNSFNERGLTPFDVLLMFQSEAGDKEIEEMLKNAGATSSKDLHSRAVTQHTVATTNNTPSKQLLEFFKYKRCRDSPSEIRNCLLVIAILIATATYQAVLSPPGGVWQDDNNSSNTSTTRPHRAGHTIMGTHNPIAYGLFLVFNSIGFFVSLHMINFLTVGFPMKLELQVSLVALIATYDTSMTAITPNRGISLFFTIFSILMPLGLPIVTKVIRDDLKSLIFGLPRTNQESTRRRLGDSSSC